MKVAELIEILKTLPQDAPLLLEGCDCVGKVGGRGAYETTTLMFGGCSTQPEPAVCIERED